MSITKTHTGVVITNDGPKRKKLHETERMWVVSKNEFYHKEMGRRHFAENTRRRLLLDSIDPINKMEYREDGSILYQVGGLDGEVLFEEPAA